MRKVNETFPDISNNRGYITSALHTKRLYLQKQPLAQVLFLGSIRENQVKLIGSPFFGSYFPGRGGRERGREFVTCLLEGEGLMFEKNIRVRHGS